MNQGTNTEIVTDSWVFFFSRFWMQTFYGFWLELTWRHLPGNIPISLYRFDVYNNPDTTPCSTNI